MSFRRIASSLTGFAALAGLLSSACLVHAESGLSVSNRWTPPSRQQLSEELTAWSQTTHAPNETKDRLLSLWAEDGDTTLDLRQLLDQSLEITSVDIWQQLQAFQDTGIYQGPIELDPAKPDAWPPAFLVHHAKFVYGKWLAEKGFYDEALTELDEPTPDQVVDPAALLFFEAACQHYLLQKDECVATLQQLLARSEGLPARYLALSQMMLKDIEPLETDSLDEVARLMRDIERRLDLGRAGKKVRQTEEDVVAKLDKMIEDLEKQRQQQQQQQQSQGGGQGSQPMQDSRPGTESGPGEIDEKEMKNKGEWGDLPPKERQEALQQISNEYPSHYRRAIEEYFRKIAREPSSGNN
ncbi:hypothetical protein AB1L30_02130 [Bremerella sp. JC817]|uniref:hypothetical protein n=1 Tax=Bremerella sp. JC817 TaxID=3231756 RepID=UPI00345A073C